MNKFLRFVGVLGGVACGLMVDLFAAVNMNNDVVGNNYLACVSTPGPDYYDDGTPVKDGEVYALVYTVAGRDFAGFRADGSLVDETSSGIGLLLPQAKNGHCRKTLCVVPQNFKTDKLVEKKSGSGVWSLYLLDTRTAEGVPVGVDESGALSRVRSWGKIEMSLNFKTDLFARFKGCAFSSERSIIPPEAQNIRITGFRLGENGVTLEVAGTKKYLSYGVVRAADLKGNFGAAQKKLKNGDDTKPIEIEATVDDNPVQYYRVMIDQIEAWPEDESEDE